LRLAQPPSGRCSHITWFVAHPPCHTVLTITQLGLTSGQTLEQWSSDISLAQAAGIDGFALNAGPSDSYGEEQVALAYAAAEGTGFVMFISFDMVCFFTQHYRLPSDRLQCCGSWTVDQVAAWINATKDSSAQLKVDGKPFVSTFEGPSFASSWASVIAQTGEIFLVPDWTSLGPAGLSQHLSKIFGACEFPVLLHYFILTPQSPGTPGPPTSAQKPTLRT